MCRGGRAGVLIADGCPMVRAGLEEVLHAIEGAELAGEAGSAEETLRLAEELRPEYVVLDHDFGVEESGVSICRALKALPETPVVVIYTRRGSPAEVALARLAGADAFIHKGADLRKLQQIKRAMCRGEPV
ncbi:MAG: response regulator [Rubrobacteraceae bacterium]|nr:response regulator transcription factor [Rubrobacteraceae bacterium]MCL6439531.1 response regulator [Rubrobacteraceae bacterium]